MARLLIIIGLLFSTQVVAIDEDYYIPYTDTYGYVYDPETGQFIKQDQASSESESSPGSANTADSMQAGNNVQPTTKTSTPLEETSSLPLVVAGLVVLAVIVFAVWFKRKKQEI